MQLQRFHFVFLKFIFEMDLIKAGFPVMANDAR